MERYAEIVAALKIRTTNKKGRHVSTARAIEFLETDGVETPHDLVKVVPGLLKRATVERLLRTSGLDYTRMVRPGRGGPLPGAAIERAVALRHEPVRPQTCRGTAVDRTEVRQADLMLFSAVDDRSGVVYQEYRCVYGDAAESALRFLFNAFAAKPVTVEIVEQVLSRAIDDLEPTLTRNGYDAGSLVSQLNARPSDVRAFLAGTLDPDHCGHPLSDNPSRKSRCPRAEATTIASANK